MTREQELIAEYEAAMNAPLSERDKELMISVLKWADIHPNWHDADKELPPLENEEYLGHKVSIKVIVSDGENITITQYDYEMDGWLVIDMGVTHWMYLPNLPKED